MRPKKFLHLLVSTLLLHSPISFSRDYIIYSIVQDLPMGEEKEIVKKNFYVNMGTQQGVESGTKLDVFRIVSRLDPYETKKRYNYKVKIGELKVLHVEESASICLLEKLNNGAEFPLFDLNQFMIGDHVDVSVK